MAEKHRLRHVKLQVWLVAEEKDLLVHNAAFYGLSSSEYIRKLILAESIFGRHFVMDKEQGKQLLFEINKIGNNINQIAYNTNAKAFASHTDWQRLQGKYFDLLTLLGQIPFLTKAEQEEWKKRAFDLLHQS